MFGPGTTEERERWYALLKAMDSTFVEIVNDKAQKQRKSAQSRAKRG